MIIYLDWNVINRIEKRLELEEPESNNYKKLLVFLLTSTAIVPYSNAHLNDLLRGAKKNQSFIAGHLDIVALITKSICICQYWNEPKPIIHKRSVVDFFQTSFEEEQDEYDTYDDLINADVEIFDNISIKPFLFGTSNLKFNRIPENFRSIYKEDPIFSIIYPQTKDEMTEYAMCCDLYNFYRLLKKDYSLYKALKKFIIQSVRKYNLATEPIKAVQKSSDTVPHHLEKAIDGIFEQLKFDSYTGVSKTYNTFFETFFRHDLQGYKSDHRFPNMIDDALHSYYGAHCDFFITNDDNCVYKAGKTYERLGIKTTVKTAEEFVLQYC